MPTKTKQAVCQHHWRLPPGRGIVMGTCIYCGEEREFIPQYLPFNKQADLSIEARHYRSDNNAEIQIAQEAMK